MRHKKYFILLLLLLVPNLAFTQKNLSFSSVNDSLKLHANSVYRFYNIQYERTSVGKVTEKVHYAITVLNKNGKSNAVLRIPYDKFTVVRNIKGTFYNAIGMQIDKLKKSDIKDYSSYQDFVLFSDNRLKYASPAANTYPYTVEYEYEVETNDLVGFDSWMPVDGYNISLENAKLTYITPIDISIKHKELNYDFGFQQSKTGGKNILTWQVNNIKAYRYEPMSPPAFNYFPVVLLSPNKFEYDGTHGDFSSWNSYGKWTYSLVKDQDQLPPETVAKIRSMVDTIPDIKNKVRQIYQYMQSRTRYVYVFLGIGGFQPFSAYDVDKYGYGDCKALSNYTKSLLNAAGIPSYYTEIGHGSNQKIRFPDFASANQTNHVILFVPLKKDTVWLECTNQKIPFGYIGAENSDRYALVISDEGGKLVKTPTYRAEDNRKISVSDIDLDENGNIKFNTSTVFEQCEYENIFGYFYDSNKEQKDDLLKSLPFHNVSLTNFDIEDESGDKARGILKLSGHSDNFGSLSGDRMFVKWNVFNRLENIFTDKQRKEAVYIPVGHTETDTVTINLPPGYDVEYIPDNYAISSVIGNYHAEVYKKDNKLQFTRYYRLNNGQFDQSDYSEITLFMNKIADYDAGKVILKKNR